MRTALPSTIKNVSVVPDVGADDRFFFGPGQPGPKRDAMGRPVLMMLASGSGARLQMAVRWAVDASVQDEIRQRIAEAIPDLEPEHVRLTPLPATVDAVQVVLCTPEGEETVLGESTSSGAYPYDALFNLSLDAEQTALALRALHGEPNVLQVRYKASLHPQTRVEARVTGDASDLVAGLPEEAGEAMVRDRVEEAIATDILREDIEGAAPEAALDYVRGQAREAAATLLLGVVRGEKTSEHIFNLDASARLSDADVVPVEAVTDLADWLDATTLASLVHIQPGAIEPPDERESDDVTDPTGAHVSDSKNRTIRIIPEVDLGRAKIRQVQVRRADGEGDEIVIREGGVIVDLEGVPPASALEVAVSYLGFGEDNQSLVKAPSEDEEPEFRLTPEDLGVAHVRVDGTALATEGAQQVRASVRYVPSGDGDRHSETVHLRREPWEADWYVVTRAPDLAGVLLVDAIIHNSTGGRERKQYETKDPVIVL